MKPPYQITSEILSLIASISEKLGEIRVAYLHKPPTELHKRNRIKTIHTSLSIEGNSLSLEQVTAIMDGKRVLAPVKDITEVQNAIEVYSRLHEYSVYNPDSLCKAHGMLMRELAEDAGTLRNRAVGVVKGSDIAHLAPPAHRVRSLLKDLFSYLKNDPDILLIKSCVFHYEFEFIHPFMDGNGRMGRLWQTLILREYNPVFEFLPVETLVKERQEEYYRVLASCDSAGDSTEFIYFMFSVINDSLERLLSSQNVNLTGKERVILFHEFIGNKIFSRSDYLRHFKNISVATASRDLRNATNAGILERTGTMRLTVYRFKDDTVHKIV